MLRLRSCTTLRCSRTSSRGPPSAASSSSWQLDHPLRRFPVPITLSASDRSSAGSWPSSGPLRSPSWSGASPFDLAPEHLPHRILHGRHLRHRAAAHVPLRVLHPDDEVPLTDRRVVPARDVPIGRSDVPKLAGVMLMTFGMIIACYAEPTFNTWGVILVSWARRRRLCAWSSSSTFSARSSSGSSRVSSTPAPLIFSSCASGSRCSRRGLTKPEHYSRVSNNPVPYFWSPPWAFA